jgi:hypothetical protein
MQEDMVHMPEELVAQIQGPHADEVGEPAVIGQQQTDTIPGTCSST